MDLEWKPEAVLFDQVLFAEEGAQRNCQENERGAVGCLASGNPDVELLCFYTGKEKST